MRRVLSACLLAVAACGPAGGPSSTSRVRRAAGADSGLVTATDSGTSTSTIGVDGGVPPDAGAGCPPPSLAAIREAIFLPSCAMNDCHGGGRPAENLDLRPGGAILRARLLERSAQSPSGLPLVTPADPASSYLYLKVFLMMPVAGDPMPPAGRLPACELNAIRDWIKTGAPDN